MTHRWFFLLASLCLVSSASAEQLFESNYNTLIMDQRDSTISIRRLENGGVVSAIDLSRKQFQVLPYTRSLFLASLGKPAPRKVLNIGLGLGAFNNLFTEVYPEADLVTAEIDKMVLDIAEAHGGFKASADNQVLLQDGRRLLSRSDTSWDWIVIDAFVKESVIPLHLTTKEFFELCLSKLSDDGVMVMNLHFGKPIFQSQVATIRAVFPGATFFKVPQRANVIAVGSKKKYFSLTSHMKAQEVVHDQILKSGGVDLAELRNYPIDEKTVSRIAENEQVLTDDFAPVEFLSL